MFQVPNCLLVPSSQLSSAQIEMAEELERQEADRKLQAEKLKNKMEVGKITEKWRWENNGKRDPENLHIKIDHFVGMVHMQILFVGRQEGTGKRNCDNV